MFNKQWFLKYQRPLLWFANTFIGKHLLRINGRRSLVGKHKIIGILPNAIFWGGKIKGYHFVKGKKVYKQEFKAEFRTHNKFSKRLFYAFYPLWWLIHQWDTIFANNFQPNWNLGFDTLTVYPDPLNPGTNTVDGSIQHRGGAAYATAHDAATGTGVDLTSINLLLIDNSISATLFYMSRSLMTFDTSLLTSGATISSAVLSLFGDTSGNVNADTDSASIVASTPAANNAYAVEDYDQFGTTKLATDIGIASINTTAYNDFSLNANGISNISLTGISRFGTRTAKDISNTAPSVGLNNVWFKSADNTGTTNDPKLVVTYTISVAGGYSFFM